MTSKERVKRAVHFNNPDKISILYFNKYTEKSDVVIIPYNTPENFNPENSNQSEWGFVWESLDGTMGQPTFHPIISLDDLDEYVLPNGMDLSRFTHIDNIKRECKDKYLMGSLGLSGFNLATFLRGCENFLMDLYLDPAQTQRLVNMVFDFEMDIIKGFEKYQLDAVSFADDWGTQKALMISPETFREVFKPLYKKQFELVHSFGMDVYFHSCGYIYDIIPDLIEIGADILNLNQPDIFGIDKLAEDFGGRVCFNCPVDHQTVAVTGTREEIFSYVQKLCDKLGCFNGGYIGYIEEYSSVGMSDENFSSINEAFMTYRGNKQHQPGLKYK